MPEIREISKKARELLAGIDKENEKVYMRASKRFAKLPLKEQIKVIEIFDCCGDCWDPEPEKCQYRPIRKKLGLKECFNFECKKRRRV